MQRRCIDPTADLCEPTAVLIRGGSRYAFRDELEGGGVYVRLDDDGRVVELFLTKNGEEITPTDLRRLPLTRIRAEAQARPDLWFQAEQNPELGADLREAVTKAFPEGWPDRGWRGHASQ